ncbi:uracil phosphoribosyltransferase [Phragmitibacter flavus]|uniref:Uracil phosphoribosyltransferase n=1 Tax=Phragmitibacter flavus TaxID=2576071 RepID=A0A5R8KCP8_9BACT|nr:uracil phosphoribosyltransferase [Phragmitibacter flavus]TLD70071.1 uracil phosphoribosyltransferase [Phragmitibacter flavus]
MPLQILQHSLAQVWVAELRDVKTETARFRSLCNRLTAVLFLEATRDLMLRSCEVQTPLEDCEGAVLGSGVVIIPVLRAGLGMVPPILELMPEAQVGHLGVERDHVTALPRCYYSNIPEITDQTVIIVDPMLATGGSLLHAIGEARAVGARDLRVLSIIAAPEGVAMIEEKEPRVMIYTAVLDRCLNEQKYILPGIGDFGDRLMGT